MDGHKHVPFLNVKANKIIIQVQMNQKIGWHTRFDLDVEGNSYTDVEEVKTQFELIY